MPPEIGELVCSFTGTIGWITTCKPKSFDVEFSTGYIHSYFSHMIDTFRRNMDHYHGNANG